MQKIYYSFISIITFFTIFIVLVSNNNYKIVVNNSSYYWPTPGYYGISSYFGKREKPTAGASIYHNGIDILANEGSKVYSIEDGEVIYAGFNSSSGYTIIISHDNNMKSIYAHLSEEILVDINEEVKKGEVIGYVGPKVLADGRKNGATTGPHLHFAIQKNGSYVNPVEFL